MDVYLIRSELAYLRVASESLWGAVLTVKMGASSWGKTHLTQITVLKSVHCISWNSEWKYFGALYVLHLWSEYVNMSYIQQV